MMERLVRIFLNAVYRVRNDRRRQVILVTGIVGLSILVAVMVDGGSTRLSGRELAVLIGGIFMGVEFTTDYQLEQDRHRRREENPDVIITEITENDE